jgi:hypothetical protein
MTLVAGTRIHHVEDVEDLRERVENQGSGNGSGHHAKRTETMYRHNIPISRIVRESSNVALFQDLTAALQNLHPRFKSGRRLQSFLGKPHIRYWPTTRIGRLSP